MPSAAQIRQALELAELQLRQLRLERERRANRVEQLLADAAVVGVLVGAAYVAGQVKRAVPRLVPVGTPLRSAKPEDRAGR